MWPMEEPWGGTGVWHQIQCLCEIQICDTFDGVLGPGWLCSRTCSNLPVLVASGEGFESLSCREASICVAVSCSFFLASASSWSILE